MLESRLLLKILALSPGGSIYDEAYAVREQNHDLTARYDLGLDGDFNANVFVGFNSNQRDYKSVSTYGTGLGSTELLQYE